MILSKALLYSDFDSAWYKKWARKLKQTPAGRGKFYLKANKFWQNAVIARALYSRSMLQSGKRCIGFGVGMERLPALFASMGITVTATDQDVSSLKASKWDNDQLAHGSQSLNIDKICPDKLFTKNVSYRAIDMKKIPRDLYGTYDFLWSNCALGHLGSIKNSLHFIEQSLQCLVPGGWAVHTTEAAILSDTETLDNSDTVFFRQRDLLGLFKQLSLQGYKVKALHFKLHNGPEDMRFTLDPAWGTDHSKLLFNGYMATQVVLVINKPRRQSTALSRRLQVWKHQLQYRINLIHMVRFRRANQELGTILSLSETANLPAADTKIQSTTKTTNVRLKKGSSRTITLKYRNESSTALFKLNGSFAGTKPVVVTTHYPINRPSRFKDAEWYGDNRPTISLLQRHGKSWLPAEYIKPGQEFAVVMKVTGGNNKPGTYEEWFCLAKEGDNVIPSTEVRLNIQVVN